MTDNQHLTADREQEIRDSIPTTYGPPWTVHPDMDDDVWRVKYATDHPLAGLVCEVPDYGAHLAEFIATARAAVPELLAEIDRLKGQRKYLIAQLAKRDAETGRGDKALQAFLADPETVPAEACRKCGRPFDPTDTSFDGAARYRETPFCRRCIDNCHESTDAFHRCVICEQP